MGQDEELRKEIGLRPERRTEMERILTYHGATNIRFGREGEAGFVTFRFKDRTARVCLPLPEKKTRGRDLENALDHWEAGCAVGWELVQNALNSKLYLVRAGLASFEEEFLARLVMADGRNFSEHVSSLVEETFQTVRE
jgi:hypothetical protein